MLVAGLGQCSWDTLFFVESYPPVDAKQEISGVTEQGGGPVATALVALSRFGISTRFAGLAGADAAGLKIADSLKAGGVDASGLLRRKGQSSQQAFIAVERATALRTIFWQRPSGGPMETEELAEDFLEGASLLLLDGLMPEASLHLAKKAHELDIPVLLDAGRVREGILELAALSGHVVGSEAFGREMGMDPGGAEAFGRKAREMFPQGLTITLGRGGCVYYGSDGIMSLAAYEVKPVDTTGAGDIFHAGFAYGVLNGFDTMRTLRFASAAAALSTLGLGGRGALPCVEDVIGLMETVQK